MPPPTSPSMTPAPLGGHPTPPGSLRELTTAESLIVEIVVAQHLLRAPHTVLGSRHWVRPQLDAMAARGLISWEYDSDANFRITPEATLLRLPEVAAMQRRLRPLGDTASA